MSNKKKAPAIRFKGFNDDWEERKLKHYLSVPKKEQIEITDISQLLTVKLNLGGVHEWSTRETLSFGSTKYYKRRAGQFIYGKQNFFNGSLAIIPDFLDGKATSADVPSLDIKNITSDYFYTYLSRENYWREKESRSTGTGSKRIHEDTLLDFEIKLPSFEEQKKIGKFFSNLDNLITLQKRRCDKLIFLKKAMLEQMFPKGKKSIPEIRFKDFNDDWEERKLGEVADIFDGTHQTPKYTDSGVKFVSVENINNLETEKYISNEAYDREYAKKPAEKGDVLMTRIGDIGTSKVIKTDEPMAYYVTLALLKPKGIDSDFLSYVIGNPRVQRDIWKRTLHIAFPKKINLGEINLVSLMLPTKTEQKQIGTFFHTLDNLITLQKRKLEKLKIIKKSMLDKMFI